MLKFGRSVIARMSDEGDPTRVTDCTRCPNLVACRSQIVNGVGPLDAEIVLVGEAPGKNEDETGEPFVGRSGSVLDDALESSGFDRSDVRITNCVRCRPPNNRDPHVAELENCSDHLERELEYIAPRVVIPLGRIPSEQVISEEFESISQAVGDVFETEYGSEETVAIASVHPAATLYNRDLRPDFERVFELASDYLAE